MAYFVEDYLNQLEELNLYPATKQCPRSENLQCHLESIHEKVMGS